MEYETYFWCGISDVWSRIWFSMVHDLGIIKQNMKARKLNLGIAEKKTDCDLCLLREVVSMAVGFGGLPQSSYVVTDITSIRLPKYIKAEVECGWVWIVRDLLHWAFRQWIKKSAINLQNSDDWTITNKTTRTIKHENFSKMKILKVDRWALSLNHTP